MWRTLAHELGHNLGGSHTFAEGGLMAYTGEYAFADSGDVCAWLGAQDDACLPPVGATCGDGVVEEESEACDDGGTADGDGCSASCAVECGFKCSVALGGASSPSSCAAGCGDGAVDLALGEECDVSAACCVGCRLAPGAACCGGECCGADGTPAPTTQLCSGTLGHCSGTGACETREYPLCQQYNNLEQDLAVCPVSAAAPCKPACRGPAGSSTAPPKHGFDEATDDPAEPGHAFEDGAVCGREDGRDGECWAGACVAARTCGDGILDLGEACDDGSACCDQSTCTLAPGARGPGKGCDEATCTFAVATPPGGGRGRRGAGGWRRRLDGRCPPGDDTISPHSCNQHVLRLETSRPDCIDHHVDRQARASRPRPLP